MDKDILNSKEAAETVGTLRALLEAATDAYEIYLSRDSGMAVETKGGEIDSFKVRDNMGVGIRTLKDKRPGFGYSSVLSSDAISAMVADAVTGSKEATADDCLGFAEPTTPHPDASLSESLIDASMDRVAEADKIALAAAIETSARAFDKRVTNVRNSSYTEGFSAGRVINSNGVDASEAATFYSGSIAVVAEAGGESQMAWDVGMGHAHSDVDAGSIGEGAAKRAVDLLGGRTIETVRAPALIENVVAIDLLSALASSLKADNVLKGKSMLIGKEGEKLFSDKINIFDDGLLPGGWSTAFTDGEGTPQQKTELVTGGVVRGYLYDTYYAERMKTHSTGNAARGGYKGAPSIGTTNLYIEEGSSSFDELLCAMDSGILITDLMGVHTINPVTGEFSLGAQGFWVEGGKPAYPVRGIAIAGTLIELFSKVSAVGSDTRFMASTGSPSLLLSELDISGEYSAGAGFKVLITPTWVCSLRTRFKR